MSDWSDWNDLVAPENRFDTPNKNASRPASITKPTHIVIHVTGQNVFSKAHNEFMNATAQRSAHYLIKKDSTIVQYAKDSVRAWHAGIKDYVKALYDKGTFEWKKYLKYFDWYKGYPDDAKYLNSDLSPATTAAESALVARADNKDWDHYAYWSKHGTRTQPINYEVSKDPNAYAIGIELLTEGSKNKAGYDDKLYDGLHVLLPDLCSKYDIPVDKDHIIGHEDVNPVERFGWDPGAGFDWDR